MRKDDAKKVEAYAREYGIQFQAYKDLLELCSRIYGSGRCDGSNDHIEDLWEEE